MHAHRDFFGAHLLKVVAQHFKRATHVGLEHDTQFARLAGGKLIGEVVERHLGLLRQLLVALLLAVLTGDFLGTLKRVGDVELVAGIGDFIDTGQLDRRGGADLRHALAAIVGHVTHAAVGTADDDEIAQLELTLLHAARAPRGRGRAASQLRSPCHAPGRRTPR